MTRRWNISAKYRNKPPFISPELPVNVPGLPFSIKQMITDFLNGPVHPTSVLLDQQLLPTKSKCALFHLRLPIILLYGFLQQPCKSDPVSVLIFIFSQLFPADSQTFCPFAPLSILIRATFKWSVDAMIDSGGLKNTLWNLHDDCRRKELLSRTKAENWNGVYKLGSLECRSETSSACCVQYKLWINLRGSEADRWVLLDCEIVVSDSNLLCTLWNQTFHILSEISFYKTAFRGCFICLKKLFLLF